MLLADQSIRKLIADGKLVIKPKAILKSASVRLHLANQFAKPGGKIFSLEEYSLKPKKLVLGATLETIKLPDDYAGLYDGSTTLARLGISSHMGSMLISPGSEGNLTLEIFNASDQPFLLKAGMRIGQLLIMKLDVAVEKPQSEISQYKGEKHKGLVLPIKKSIYRRRQR